jgi:hypothetical protein
MAHRDSSHRRPLLDERCARHQFEAAVDQCRQCGFAFCGECVVYAFGEHQPPYCIPCALAASGVRSGAARQPALPKKELRRREKEARRAAKEAEQVAAAQASEPQIDWSLPIIGNGAANSNGNGHHPPAAPTGAEGNGTAPPDAPPPPAAPPPVAPEDVTKFPSFDDAPSSGRPQAPVTPPKAPGRSSRFGRGKGKAVPF